MKTAINTLDNIVVKRPSSKINKKKKQNLCLDKGYDFQEIENSVIILFIIRSIEAYR